MNIKNDTKKSFLILNLIMIFCTFCITAITIFILYNYSIKENKIYLEEIVSSQSRMIESMVDYQLNSENKTIDYVREGILFQLVNTFSKYSHFKESGEIVFAKIAGPTIEYLLINNENNNNTIIPRDSKLSEAMGLALNNSSGTIVGKDFRGVNVLAAYDYINFLDIGIVAKIEIKEINQPFIKAFGVVAVITILLSFLLLYRVNSVILSSVNIEKKKLLKANKKLKYEILEHHETEEKLKLSQEKLSQIIKKSPIPMLIVNSDQNIEFFNDKFSEIFGFTRLDYVNERDLWEKLFPNETYRTIAHSNWAHIITNSKQENLNTHSRKIWSITTKDGSLKNCEVFVVVTPGTTYLVLNDVTEQKKMELALIKAKNKAEELSHTKSNFLSTFSHEIRTPINGVLGMVELILGTKLTDEQLRFTKSIKVSGNILLQLVNDILDISKIEAHMLVLELVEFNLQTLLQDFVDIQSYKTKDKNIQLTLDIPDDLPVLLKGDPGRIRQILLNLVGNSFKFTTEGKISVSLKKINEIADFVTIQITVSDTGIGIEQDRLGIIFDKFTQADTSTTRKYGGTGLGLAITKELVEIMDGEISVASEVGIGTTFTVVLRLEKQPMTKEYNILEHDIKNIKIMMLCDKQDNFEQLLSLTKYWNMDIVTATQVEVAIRMLKDSHRNSEPIKVLLVDIHDSYLKELSDSIKNDIELLDTKIITLSPINDNPDIRTLEKWGYSAYLTKPLKKADLYNVLFHLYNMGRSLHPIVTKQKVSDMLYNNSVILLADDNRINQKVASAILEKNGYIVDIAGDGVEVVDILSERKYNLVLMDCDMPRVDGYSATKIIRSEGSQVLDHNVPIIAMTANATKSDKEKCLKNGMNDFISKPIDPEILLNMIRRHII